jgi:hypothetical protein
MTEEGETPKRKAAGKKAAGARAAKAEGAGGAARAKKDDAGEASVMGQIARLLVKAIWVQEYSAANPESTTEQRQAAWKAARETAIPKNLKTYRKALNQLTRAGVVMSVSEVKKTKKAEASDADAE